MARAVGHAALVRFAVSVASALGAPDAAAAALAALAAVGGRLLWNHVIRIANSTHTGSTHVICQCSCQVASHTDILTTIVWWVSRCCCCAMSWFVSTHRGSGSWRTITRPSGCQAGGSRRQQGGVCMYAVSSCSCSIAGPRTWLTSGIRRCRWQQQGSQCSGR
jgi:hypothetical protein